MRDCACSFCWVLRPCLLFGDFLPKGPSTATVWLNRAVAPSAGTCQRQIAYPMPSRLRHSSIPSGVNVNQRSRLLLPDLFYTYLPALSPFMQTSLPHFVNAHETEQSAETRGPSYYSRLRSPPTQWSGWRVSIGAVSSASHSPALKLFALNGVDTQQLACMSALPRSIVPPPSPAGALSPSSPHWPAMRRRVRRVSAAPRWNCALPISPQVVRAILVETHTRHLDLLRLPVLIPLR